MLEAIIYIMIPISIAYASLPMVHNAIDKAVYINRRTKDKRRLRQLKRKGISYE